MAYSDKQKAEALIRLAVNGNDFKKTAGELGIPFSTLWRWDKNENIRENENKKIVIENEIDQKVTLDIPTQLEVALGHLLSLIPTSWDGNAWAVAVGILTDKWQLLRGGPTQRLEMIFQMMDQMPDDELNSLISEFEAAARRDVVSKDIQGDAQTAA